MAALKLADYVQRSISLFLFGTTLFAGYITYQNVRRRRMKTSNTKLEKEDCQWPRAPLCSADHCQLPCQFLPFNPPLPFCSSCTDYTGQSNHLLLHGIIMAYWMVLYKGEPVAMFNIHYIRFVLEMSKKRTRTFWSS